MSGIKVQPVEWSEFLPKTEQTTQFENRFTDKTKQYMFCYLDREKELPDCEKITLLPNLYIFIFNVNNINQILDTTRELERSGTLLLGEIIFNDFYQELFIYTFKIVPFILILLLFLIPLHIWVDILLEMSLYTFFLSLVLRLDFLEINLASLLSLVFLIIYSLTLINYLYSQGMSMRRLFFGIQISIVATMVSAFFLINSDFGLIHAFGVMLMVGLVVLHIYMNIRIFLVRYIAHSYHEQTFESFLDTNKLQKKKYAFIGLLLLLILFTVVMHENLTIDVNMINVLSHNSKELSKIKKFEEEHIPTLPFVIAIQTKRGNFTEKQVLARLLELEKEIGFHFSGKIIKSFSKDFLKFQNMAREKDNPNLFAQFLLANQFVDNKIELFSSDMKSTFIVATIALTSSSDQIISMKKEIESFEKKYPEFTIELKGKIADFENYLMMFVKEFLVGVLITLSLSALFFMFYCKNILSALLVIASVVFSLVILMIIHIIFNKVLSLVTLLSIILYIGLIADSLIQLFICYKSSQEVCEKSVLHPIFVSNLVILLFLFGMLFVDGMLFAFAFDMSILLVSNLFFIIWIVPMIHKKFPMVCNERAWTY